MPSREIVDETYLDLAVKKGFIFRAIECIDKGLVVYTGSSNYLEKIRKQVDYDPDHWKK